MKKSILIISCLGVIFISFFILPKMNNNSSNSVSNPKANTDVTKVIANILGEDYQTYQINDTYLNAYNDKQSIIVSQKDGEVKTIQDLIDNDNQEKFKKILQSEVSRKYPKFIADVINKGEGQDKYTFNQDGILVEFLDYTITPAINESLSIILSCKNIQNLLDTNCQVTDKDDYNQPKLDANRPAIALTFDDGPNGNTKTVVQALLDNKAKATFFMLGQNMYSYRSTVKLVYDSGLEVGSHTYSHKYLTKITDEERKNEVENTNRIFNEITGDTIKLIRAPYGESTKDIRNAIGLPFIQWSVDTLDWQLRDAQKVADYVINNVQDGDIILLHDIHATSAEAVGIFLPELYAKGYQVTSVSELAKLKGIDLEKGNLYRTLKK